MSLLSNTVVKPYAPPERTLEFARLKITVSEGVPADMIVVNSGGQTTIIKLADSPSALQEQPNG